MQHEPTNAELALGLNELSNKLEKSNAELALGISNLGKSHTKLSEAIISLAHTMHAEFASIHATLKDHTRRLGNIEEKIEIMEHALDDALVQLVNHESRIGTLEKRIA